MVGCWHGYLSGVRCRLAYGTADATAAHCLLLPFHWLFAVVYVSNNNEESFAQAADHSTMPTNVIVVGFYLGDEAIPYRTTVEGPSVTLGRFKQLISKRGSYRSLESDVCSFALMFFTCKLH